MDHLENYILKSMVHDGAAQAEVNVFHISAVVAACSKEPTQFFVQILEFPCLIAEFVLWNCFDM